MACRQGWQASNRGLCGGKLGWRLAQFPIHHQLLATMYDDVAAGETGHLGDFISGSPKRPVERFTENALLESHPWPLPASQKGVVGVRIRARADGVDTNATSDQLQPRFVEASATSFCAMRRR